jgi:hypothetical protein
VYSTIDSKTPWIPTALFAIGAAEIRRTFCSDPGTSNWTVSKVDCPSRRDGRLAENEVSFHAGIALVNGCPTTTLGLTPKSVAAEELRC